MPLFKRGTVSWGVLAIEMVAIMLSVVLGFALNEWRMGRAEARAVTAAQESIARELEGNLQQTTRLRERFQAVDDSLAVLQEQQGPDAPVDPFFGALGYRFNQGAYEAARASGALANMDFDILEMITTTYFTQEYRTEIGMLYIEQVINRGPSMQTVGDYRQWMQDMLSHDLPYRQKVTLRVLRGESINGAQEEVRAELSERDK